MSLLKPEAITLYLGLHGAYLLATHRTVPLPISVEENFLQMPTQACTGLWDSLTGLQDAKTGSSRLRIVLSDRLVRYICIEELPGMRSSKELELLAASRHQQVFGQDAENWKIMTDLEVFAKSHVTCAINQLLLSGLTEGSRKAGFQLVSVQPAFIAAQRQWHKKIKNATGWFALLADDSTAIGYRGAHGWAGIRVHPGAPDSMEELMLMLDRTRLYFCPDIESDTQQVWLCGGKLPPMSPAPDCAWQFIALPAAFFTQPDAFTGAEGVSG